MWLEKYLLEFDTLQACHLLWMRTCNQIWCFVTEFKIFLKYLNFLKSWKGFSGENCREDNRFLSTFDAVKQLDSVNLPLLIVLPGVIILIVIIAVFWLQKRPKKTNDCIQQTDVTLLDNKTDCI